MRVRLPYPDGDLWKVRCHFGKTLNSPFQSFRLILYFRLIASFRSWWHASFLYSTIAVAGIRVLGLISWARRNRFLLTVALGFGFIDIVQPKWFNQILNYSGSNAHLQGFEQGIGLIVETPFIVAAVVGVFLNLGLPKDKQP